MSAPVTPTEIGALVGRVADFLLAQGRGPAGSALLAQSDRRRESRPVIVVAGEDKRGKSSLVNALLACPDLSPVGAKVVTGSPITFHSSAEPIGEISYYGSDRVEPVSLERAQEIATVEANPGNEANVSGVRIGLDLPFLQVATVVDTPGVGGLESGHAELTLQSLSEADALVFVVDSSSPLRAAELSFLRRAAQRLQAVVIVLTKTDVNPGWRTIRDDDAALIAEYAPRFTGAPICPVSSLSALRALATQDDEFIAEIRTESGIAGFEELLRTRIADEVELVRSRNLLRAAITAVVGLERDLREKQAALAPDGSALERLRGEKDRMRALREDKVTVPARLEADVRKLTIYRQDLCSRRIIDIRQRYTELARNARAGEFAELPGALQAELIALGGELNEVASQRLAEVLTGILDDIEQSSLLAEAAGHIDAGAVIGQLAPFVTGNSTVQHNDRMTLLNSVVAGRSMLSLLGGTSAAAFLAPPFGLIVGLGLGGLFAFQAWRDKGRRDTAQDFRAWMNEQVSNAQLTINNDFAMRAVDLQTHMRTAIRAALADREAAIAVSIEQAQGLHRQSQAEQQRAKDQLNRQIRTATDLRSEAARLLARAERVTP